MNKADLIAAVAQKNAITRKDAEKLVSSVLDAITETLAAGEKVSLVGFGALEVKTRAAHEGINPMTKEKIQIPESKSPVFKAGKQLKDAVNK
ncbi:MAG: HU family DNA-binding protein [Christensenellaceae bacterium]|jgi:DNA-binding protein HU-beta|nr:HU family DNA-binding protein [Christensenellaceae bacterium]